MKKKLICSITVIALCGLVFADISAQCPMCKIAAESNLQNGGTEGKGLNTGILYMLSLPYIMVATIGFLWWKNNRKQMDEERAKEGQIIDLLD
jgi:hypothetical protein